MSRVLLHSSLTLTSSTQTHLMEREVEAQFQGQGAGNNIKWPRWDCSNGLSRLDLPNAPKCPFSPHLFTGCLPSPSVPYFMVKFRWWHGQFSVWVLSNPGHGVVITRSSAGLHSEITNNLVKERKKNPLIECSSLLPGLRKQNGKWNLTALLHTWKDQSESK